MSKDSSDVLQSLKNIINYIGDDSNRNELKDTPQRVVDSYAEIFSGYNLSPREVLLSCQYVEDYGDIICLKDIEFTSFCEHHMLPFSGSVNIAYIPNHKIVGISKLARVVDIFAKRLQLQERLTKEIAQSIYEHLAPKGVAVFITASHYCMKIRGVRNSSSKMKTSYYLGDFQLESQQEKLFRMMV